MLSQSTFLRRIVLGAMLLAGFAGPFADRPVAATFPELYTVSVAIDPAANASRAEIIRRGMGLLLTRITGRQEAAALPNVDTLLRNAESYLFSYSPLASEVRVGFRRNEINEALTRLNLPVWGAERPATLLWVAADLGNGQRAELAADSGAGRRGPVVPGAVLGAPSNRLDPASEAVFESLTETMLEAADERGLPLVLPTLDASDRELVRFADVWGGFDRFVTRAAERYAVDAVLIARAETTDLGVEVRWTLIRGDSRQEFVTSSPRQGVDYVANQFAAELATLGGARPFRVSILGIERWADYGRVVDYLNSLSVVESVDVEAMSGSNLILRIVARGDNATFRRTLTIDGQLAPPPQLPGTVSTAAEAEDLTFVPAWLERPRQGDAQ